MPTWIGKCLSIPANESALVILLCVCTAVNAALLVAVVYLVDLVVRQWSNEIWLLMELLKK